MATDPILWPVPGAGELYWIAEWLTDAMQPPTGLSVHRRLREHPRVRVGFDGLSTGQQRRWLENLLEAGGARDWWVPLPAAGYALPLDLPAGSLGVPGAPGAMFAAGGAVAILDEDSRLAELLTVDQVEAGGLLLLAETQRAHGTGAWVAPCFRGYLAGAPNLSRFTGDTLPWRVEFALTDPLPVTPAALATYRDFPVLEIPHDWTADPSWQPSREVVTEDNETGPVWRADLRRQAAVAMARNITAAGDAAVAELLGTLWALAGRCMPVWVHTMAADLVPVANVTAAGSTMDVEWAGLGAGPRPPGRRDIRIELRSGQVIRRRVVSVASVSPDVERLTLDAPTGVAFTPAQVFQVSWLTLCTQTADTARLNWWRHDVATTALTFQQVPTEP